ncbi:hypothetical protein SAMN05421874_13374 [Nonomuraea maritima]|uniref:Uncharacterized protein n=2 Tax=Nonomuraea maritima TaxID=683260 RepID=A0A1G9PA62_9ACTN|nr:hypothetical protein SAMN05421874_13374 [Nonomuraea maritima]
MQQGEVAASDRASLGERKAGRRRRLSVFDAVIMAGGLMVLAFAAYQAGPALAAATGDGPHGTFTAVRQSCFEHHPGKWLCTWRGDFRSDDGKVVREGVTLYDSEQDTMKAGQTVRAFDTGRPDHVYGEDGSREWVTVAILLALGAGLASRPLWTRRRPRPAPDDDARETRGADDAEAVAPWELAHEPVR